VLIGRAAPLDNPRHAVAVAKSAARHPHPATQIGSGDLAVLPDSQRRSTRVEAIKTHAPNAKVEDHSETKSS
jgi:hypothetical protein